ncbi:hypothetical protein [uncultured Jatrophihabitans sp.]|uniref:hypothetical protein n=1 Tax=uncultured Jatrophihabitans sp. TaxID=1610747 RepID=UPI0035CBC630
MLVYAAVRTGRDLPQLADDVAEAADLAQRCQLIGPAVVEHSPRSPIRTTPRYPTWSTREN